LSFLRFFLYVIMNFLQQSLLPLEEEEREAKGGSDLKEEEIVAKLKEAVRDGKISCALAQKFALENKISMKQVGDLLNQMKIKITQCQLGCF
jgi:hypothetical protein